MDAVDPIVLDRWIAYELHEQDLNAPDNSVESALGQLGKL